MIEEIRRLASLLRTRMPRDEPRLLTQRDRRKPMQIFRHLANLLSIALLICLSVASAHAQTPAAAPAAPAIPPVLTEPGIDAGELQLRLVPLTKEELAVVAQKWLAIVKAKTTDVLDAQVDILHSKGEAQSAARQRLTTLAAERDRLFDKFSEVVSALEKKGGDEAAIKSYRTYKNAILVEETRTSDFQTLAARVMAWATARDGGIALVMRLSVIIVSLIALVLVARLVRRTAVRAIGRVPNLSKLLQAFLVTVIYWLVLAFGLMIVLSALGVDISPVFALIGGASFILAFAFQDTLSNLAAGLMIMANRPFDEGHYVSVGGVSGTVKAVSIVATTVTTPDNQMIVIPNKQVWGAVITNVTASPTRRVDMTFGIGYGDSIETAQSVLEQVVKGHPLVLADPAPVIRVSALADNSVNFIVRPWTRGADYWTVYWDLTRQVKEAFDRAGISIPYPQRDVHLHMVDGRAPLAVPGAVPPARPATVSADEAEARGAEGHDAV